jgi:AraC-like DNA-binding protein
MKYIIAIGIFQAVAIAILLWRSKLRNNTDRLLIILVVCIAMHLSIKFFIYTYVKDSEVLNMMHTFIGLCYLPLLYLYALKTIQPNFVPASRWYMFIPFILGAIGYFSVISSLAAAPEIGHTVLYWYNTISLWTMLPLDIILACLIIRMASRQLSNSPNERKLIIQVASIFLAIGIMGVVFTVIAPLGFNFNYISRSIIYTLLVVICIRIITYRYLAFVNPVSQNPRSEKETELPFANEISIIQTFSPPNKFVDSARLPVSPHSNNESSAFGRVNETVIVKDKRKEILDNDEMRAVIQALETAMSVKLYYTDSELTLDKLSALTKQSKYHVSESLNRFLQKPFYAFINEYRVQHVKDKLKLLSVQHIEINMLALAHDAGFNSKSSFNRYFKEITGQTPTEYYRMLIKNLQPVIANG